MLDPEEIVGFDGKRLVTVASLGNEGNRACIYVRREMGVGTHQQMPAAGAILSMSGISPL